MKLLIQHTHLKSHLQNLKTAKNTMTLIAHMIPLWTQNGYHGKTKLLKLNYTTQNMPQIFQSKLTTINQYPYLTHNLTGTQFTSQQNLFIVPFL